jgi:hypothetical protein
MNLNPAELLNPIFNTLDSLIENDGVYLYLVFVWLALLVIAWIFSGGLRKRMKGNSTTVIPASSSRCNRRDNPRRQSSASRLTRHGTMTTKQRTNHETFHSRQSDCGRRVRKKANASTFNFTSQIAPSICTVIFTKREKSVCNNFQVTVQVARH